LDGHEVSPHLRTSHSYRPAGGNLLLEDRNDASIAHEHVSKSHAYELGLLSRGKDGALSRNNQFGDTFRQPHDAGRLDGLVGRDQQEIRYVRPPGSLSQIPSSQDIVSDCFADLPFHQRHMLVRSGVKNGIHAMITDGLLHLDTVSNVTDLDDQ